MDRGVRDRDDEEEMVGVLPNRSSGGLAVERNIQFRRKEANGP